MDFLDPKKKRAHKIRLYVGYILMAIALSIGTLILLLEAYGYDVNRQTGEIIQNGLVFVDTHPESARIFVNGKYEGDTGKRLVLPTGDYKVELQRDGYRMWTRSFNLEGSIVERLSYAFLFPTELKPSDIQLYKSMPKFATQSPDRRWVLVQQPGELRKLDMVDLGSNANTTTTVTLPESLLTAAKGEHKLVPVEWSTDNRRVLVKHSYQGGMEFVVIDRERPTESFNVNKTFNLSPSQVALRDKKFDKLHLLDAKTGVLRFGDVRTKQLVQIDKGVKAFKSYAADVLVYVIEPSDKKKKAVVRVRRDSDTYKLRELPRSALYRVDVTKYDGRWYMAAGSDASKRAYVYMNPFDVIAQPDPHLPAPVDALELDNKLEHMSFSANARFLGIQGGSEFAVYDAEHDRQYRYDTKLKLPAGYKATWMDGHRYMVVSQGKVVVFDYDGINTQELLTADRTFLPFFDRDYDNLYTIGPSVAVKGKPGLIKAPVRTAADR